MRKLDKKDLKKFFNLQSKDKIFKDAVTPKSCGGGDGFKYLALLGDFILNLTLLILHYTHHPN